MNSQENIRRLIFVSRQLGPEALRSAQALHQLRDVCLFGIGETNGNAIGDTFLDFIAVDDAESVEQLVAAASHLRTKHGPIHQIITAHEALLEPVAIANEVLATRGIDVSTVRRVLDKSLFKAQLEKAGIKTPRAAVLVSHNAAAHFVASVGFPIVLKPLKGSGGLASWCVRNLQELSLAVELMQPSERAPVLAEEYVSGEEVCVDTITLDNQPRLYTVCHYHPSILEALENSEIQWRCVMPRNVNDPRFGNLIEEALRAVQVLHVGNAMTHMEGFLLADGTHRFIDATLRPAGARIGPMLGFAFDIDSHLAWARASVDGSFDGPWDRKYAVGTIFLRGTGAGVVTGLTGNEVVTRELSDSIVAARWPHLGAKKSATYTGDGYVTIRHPETERVNEALDFIARTVVISYSDPQAISVRSAGSIELLRERLQYNAKQLNQPVWENEFIATSLQHDVK